MTKTVELTSIELYYLAVALNNYKIYWKAVEPNKKQRVNAMADYVVLHNLIQNEPVGQRTKVVAKVITKLLRKYGESHFWDKSNMKKIVAEVC